MKPLKIKKERKEGYNEWIKYIHGTIKKIKNDTKKSKKR